MMRVEAKTELKSDAVFDIDSYIDLRRAWVNDALDSYLSSETAAPISLRDAMRYSLMCGGKRLRPILALAGAEVVGGDPKLALPLACAVETIHTFSLIHDDLPAIDNDILRRGKPTSHVVFGESVAILAGDALLARSFELISMCADTLPATAVIKALRLIAQASGTLGMVGGQVDDIEAEAREGISLEAVDSIHDRKTGALLTASLVAGALLFEPDQTVISSLENYGHHLGLAFQITDDLLDIEGDEATLGKPIGSDVKRDKATYPKLLGIGESRLRANQAANSAVEALSSFGSQAEPLRALARYMVERKS
jgi:geranylgeranyl diphosphate synthase type II